MNKQQLLYLLQLGDSALPLGSYSYSEGLENLVENNLISDDKSLQLWIIQELKYGTIRIETAIMSKAYDCFIKKEIEQLNYWNNWLSANRETSELRQQSWQMGNSLIKLIQALEFSNYAIINITNQLEKPFNYAIIFGIVSANWKLEKDNAILLYLKNWVTSMINAGVKLIPLGQTQGQKILFNMLDILPKISEQILSLKNTDLVACNWGLSLASMNHETQYSRLFRS